MGTQEFITICTEEEASVHTADMKHLPLCYKQYSSEEAEKILNEAKGWEILYTWSQGSDYGYDMRLVDDDGSVTYIEVKTSSKSWDEGLLLFLSDREHQFALDHADRYLVYYVSGIKKGKDAKIIVLSDLFKNGELNKENYSIRCERNYIISAEPE